MLQPCVEGKGSDWSVAFTIARARNVWLAPTSRTSLLRFVGKGLKGREGEKLNCKRKFVVYWMSCGAGWCVGERVPKH